MDERIAQAYNKWIGKITCAFHKDITFDKNGNSACYARRTEERAKYLFTGFPNPEIALIQCPPDVLPIEFEEKENHEINRRWIAETKTNAEKLGLDCCIADHGGTSPWLYLFNLEGMPEDNKGLRIAKLVLAHKLIPKETIEKKKFDESNLGDHLIPIIGRPHWKHKYKGAIHALIEGKNPADHKNKVHNLILPPTAKKTSNQKRDNFFVKSVYEKTTLEREMRDLGFDLTKNPTRCIWHASEAGKSFSYDLSNNVWYCFNPMCVGNRVSGGGIIQLTMRNHNISFGDAVMRLCTKHGVRVSPPNSQRLTDHEKEYFRELFQTGMRDAIQEISNYLVNTQHIKTTSDNESMFYYEDGIYNANGEIIIKTIIEEILGKYTRNNICTEIVGHIKRLTCVARETLYATPIHLVCVKNGVLDIMTKELKPHTPELLFLNQIPVMYDEKQECKSFHKFLDEILDEKGTIIIQELFGYLLYRRYNIQKAFMFTGGGANGKSVLMKIMERFLGGENISHRSLQDLETNRFAKGSLFGKMANIFFDLPREAMKESNVFKMVTSEDVVDAEEKFKGVFAFVNHAKLIFSANQVPASYDETDAYFRRWVIINFPNQFLGKDADPNLARKLCTPDGFSGILNWAIEGLHRLLGQGYFSFNEDIGVIRDKYVRLSDSAQSFIKDCLKKDIEGYIVKTELYASYLEYCKKNGMIVQTEDRFFKCVKREMVVLDYRPKIGGSLMRAFKGISFVDGYHSIHTIHPFSIKEENKESIVHKGADVLKTNSDRVDREDREDSPSVSDVLPEKEAKFGSEISTLGSIQKTTLDVHIHPEPAEGVGIMPEHDSGKTPESQTGITQESRTGIIPENPPNQPVGIIPENGKLHQFNRDIPNLKISLEFLGGESDEGWLRDTFGEELIDRALREGVVFKPRSSIIKLL